MSEGNTVSLLIREAEVASLIDMPQAIAAVEDAHRALAAGLAHDTPRERTRTPQTVLHILQGAYPPAGVIGYKAYTSNRSGTRFFVHLFDIGSGAPLAVIEANALGRLRTGAAAGVATRHLARSEASVLAVIGAGGQAASQIEAVCAVRPIREVRVFARRRPELEAFCRDMAARVAAPVLPAASAQAAVEGADIVSTITTSASPVIDADWLAPGMHINAAGSNSLIRRELDEASVRRADLLCVDARETALREAGDLLPLLEKGRTHPRHWVELGEVVSAQRAGRASAEAITLFESQGLAVQDLALAAQVLEAARAAGVGQPLPY